MPQANNIDRLDFSTLVAGNTVAVPQEAPAAQPKPEKQKTGQTVRPLIDGRQAARVIAVIAVTFSLFLSILFMRIYVMHLEQDAAALQTKISYAKSEGIRLNRALDTVISREKIDEYAVGTLGMRPIERYQIRYFADEGGDRVVISDGKAVQ
ncbi:MAG: hypothetical protein IKD72_06870 [Clostridia bacterium]|nr:hypothetical protein [Clostridia bacterium]